MFETDILWHARGPYNAGLGPSLPPPPPPAPPQTVPQFLRMPPMPFGPPTKFARQVPSVGQSRIADPVQASEKVDELRRLFCQHAAGLLSTGVKPIPPGHPLHDGQISIRSLEAERDSLLKENAGLKKRLDDRDGPDSRQPHPSYGYAEDRTERY